jgi:uncharacterized membrane protein
MMRFLLLELFRPSLRHLAVGVCAAGVLHLCIALAAPEVSVSRGYRDLTQGLELHKFKLLPPITPAAQKLPYMGPEARYAVCLFDARDGTVSVSARLPTPGWVLSIFNPAGENIYSAVTQPTRSLDIALTIVPAEESHADIAALSGSGTLKDDTSLQVVASKGLLVVRAPDQGSAYLPRNLATLSEARCSYRARRRGF